MGACKSSFNAFVRMQTMALLVICSGQLFGQEKRGKPVAADWESTYYYSYFGRYYYGHYKGLGAADFGVEVGLKGKAFDITTWFHDRYGAGLGFAFGNKSEFGLSFIFAYAITPKWQVNPAPVIRFIPESPEKEKHIKAGFDVDVIYYYWKNIGIKAGYSTTSQVTLGANFRLSNFIFER